MREPPDGSIEIEEIMSNFDLEIRPGAAEELRAGGVWGRHSAWNFNGRVWFADDEFNEQVWVYGNPITSYSAQSLEELMQLVNKNHGSD